MAAPRRVERKLWRGGCGDAVIVAILPIDPRGRQSGEAPFRVEAMARKVAAVGCRAAPLERPGTGGARAPRTTTDDFFFSFLFLTFSLPRRVQKKKAQKCTHTQKKKVLSLPVNIIQELGKQIRLPPLLETSSLEKQEQRERLRPDLFRLRGGDRSGALAKSGGGGDGRPRSGGQVPGFVFGFFL